MVASFDPEQVAATYDAVAEEYASRFLNELDGKPGDRDLLDAFAASVGDRGRVCDLGCGPGHVARYLADRGVEVEGIDLSPTTVGVARRLHPHLTFSVGDMHQLAVEDATWAGIVAFYSVIHLPREELSGVFRELRRTLQPAGLLLLSAHGGKGEVEVDDWFGMGVGVAATLYRLGDLTTAVEEAGFVVEQAISRAPYPGEGGEERLYLLARTPA